ncbi:MAG: hypothetical protein AABX07_03910 [Nanoarchaeota archaeon]
MITPNGAYLVNALRNKSPAIVITENRMMQGLITILSGYEINEGSTRRDFCATLSQAEYGQVLSAYNYQLPTKLTSNDTIAKEGI